MQSEQFKKLLVSLGRDDTLKEKVVHLSKEIS